MRRIFGISKDRKKKNKGKEEGEEEPPKPTVGEISGKTDARIQNIEQKIADCDKKLVPLKRKIKRCKGAAKLRYKKQAMMILKRRKMYEKQLDNLSAMHLNTLSIVDTIENAKATQEMAVAMKESVKQLKEQQEQFSLDDMEDVYVVFECEAREFQSCLSLPNTLRCQKYSNKNSLYLALLTLSQCNLSQRRLRARTQVR